MRSVANSKSEKPKKKPQIEKKTSKLQTVSTSYKTSYTDLRYRQGCIFYHLLGFCAGFLWVQNVAKNRFLGSAQFC
jgi:hypothetical protein